MFCNPVTICSQLIGSSNQLAKTNAAMILESLANSGNTDALFEIGVAAQQSMISRVNRLDAKRFYERAAQNGHVIAMRNLGIIFQVGEGVELDWDKAANWYEKAVQKGDSKSAENMAYLYANGWRPKRSNLQINDWHQVKDRLLNNKLDEKSVAVMLKSFQQSNNKIKERKSDLSDAISMEAETSLRLHPRRLRSGSLWNRLKGESFVF